MARQRSSLNKRKFSPFTIVAEFIRLESSSGIILFMAAILAVVLANTTLYPFYQILVHASLEWRIGHWHYHTSLLSVTNEALMAIFFLLVGLEVKREMLVGELNSKSKVILPGFAALGGMIVPSFIYVIFNWNEPQTLRGWAIPAATDIAFALGVLALLGKRAPLTIKLFLMALAIFDDIGAILIITLFYQSTLQWFPLWIALALIVLLFFLNHYHVVHLFPYLVIGIVLWVVMLESGIHPTLAGVLLAFAIPLRKSQAISSKKEFWRSPLERLEHKLHPWVAYGVLPLFSFSNAGLNLSGFQISELFSPLSLGIMAGLWLGKQLGVFGTAWLAIRLGWASMPVGANWRCIYGVSLICGIGFTMSLFIGNLAFADFDDRYMMMVRFSVFVGSLLSGISGYLLLRLPYADDLSINEIKEKK